ncbi:MAG: diguanylate cyclase [Planctomycetaceae bacterium]|jgi:diguanylate cyclase (GGDEF)-like protein|nr:diguanylate cyclase [Planctomycetaceae bacterium]
MFIPREKSSFQSANILLVDDDPAILRLLSHILEQEGHQTRVATDGNMALQYIIQDCPDVIITDWQMPGIDGLELCRRVRHLHQCKVLSHYSYIVVLSAHSGKKNLLEGLDAGADDFVEKGSGDMSDLRVELLIRLKAALRTREMECDLEYAAKYDGLTSLLNRHTFFDNGSRLWEKTRYENKTLSAIMLDCDYFKRINDLYGHQAGDLVLQTFASALLRHSRAYDLISRYGGEEFCILLPGCDENVACQWTERIRKQLEVLVVPYENKKIKITASFGVAERAEDVLSLDALVERADQALLFAKESGRNRSVKYSAMILDRKGDGGESYSSLMNSLFEEIMACDVMTPIVLTVPRNETAANIADFFLETRMDSLAVVDQEENFVGLISEKTFLSIIGDTKRWHEPISDMVMENVITYSEDTPLKIIFNFLERVSVQRVIILQDKKPVGFISRNLLLRWLRNGWVMHSKDSHDIIPRSNSAVIPFEELMREFEHLMQEMAELRELLHQFRQTEPPCRDSEKYNKLRNGLITKISKSQELADQILQSTFGRQNSADAECVSHDLSGKELFSLGIL